MWSWCDEDKTRGECQLDGNRSHSKKAESPVLGNVLDRAGSVSLRFKVILPKYICNRGGI